jgi:peptidoglycan hydrolase CwlO-like protein
MSQTTELTTEALLIMILDKKLQENLRPFHRAMDDLKQSVNFISDKFDSLTNKVSEVEEKCEDTLKENKFLKAEVLRLSYSIKQNSEALCNIEQYSRRECIEISGLAEEKDENTNELTIKVGSLIGLDTKKVIFQ